MARADANDPKVLAHYEGLVWKTASRYAAFVEEDFEDIQQILRVKIWRALMSYDPSKSKMTRDRYVFSCVVNQCKDLVKRKRRNELFIEDIAPASAHNDFYGRDFFDGRYLSETHDQTYGHVDEDEVLIPSTLDDRERRVVALLYASYTQNEIARRLAIPTGEVAKSVRSIREKMADWRPDTGDDAEVIQLRPQLEQERRAA